MRTLEHLDHLMLHMHITSWHQRHALKRSPVSLFSDKLGRQSASLAADHLACFCPSPSRNGTRYRTAVFVKPIRVFVDLTPPLSWNIDACCLFYIISGFVHFTCYTDLIWERPLTCMHKEGETCQITVGPKCVRLCFYDLLISLSSNALFFSLFAQLRPRR